MLRRMFQSQWRPKNFHSLENLKHLYLVLTKNSIVTDQNRSLLVETLRSISEILIWGDQNDSSVFDFFFEKNMLAFFKRIMRQKSGEVLCQQLLQTLNILFENVSKDTSLYFLLSNNHINNIITHKFDFSDEEIMAYYISFLKTLSLKLNVHTISFFFNEHSADFPLLTEAIKFHTNSESMVRIAVRTITLNCLRVPDMLARDFVMKRVADIYFENLIYSVGNQVLSIEKCLDSTLNNNSLDRLRDLVAEHVDNLCFIQDIFALDVQEINECLAYYLLNHLIIPIYLHSLVSPGAEPYYNFPRTSLALSLYCVAQFLIVIQYEPLIKTLIFLLVSNHDSLEAFNVTHYASFEIPDFLVENVFSRKSSGKLRDCSINICRRIFKLEDYPCVSERIAFTESLEIASALVPKYTSLIDRPHLTIIFKCLECRHNDRLALLALLLIHALWDNYEKSEMCLSSVYLTPGRSDYNCNLYEYLTDIISAAVGADNPTRIRHATFQFTCVLLRRLLLSEENKTNITPSHSRLITKLYQTSSKQLSSYINHHLFLEVFEDDLNSSPLDFVRILNDASVLLPPVSSPLTRISPHTRLPACDVERLRQTVLAFLRLRSLLQAVGGQDSPHLDPIVLDEDLCKNDDRLNLESSDLIRCCVEDKERFLLASDCQLLLVEPDKNWLGWGVVRFAGPLYTTQVASDSNDHRCLQLTVHRVHKALRTNTGLPLLATKLVFDDHIRCMAARQRIQKGAVNARKHKLNQIGSIIHGQSQKSESVIDTQPVPIIITKPTVTEDALNCVTTSENQEIHVEEDKSNVDVIPIKSFNKPIQTLVTKSVSEVDDDNPVLTMPTTSISSENFVDIHSDDVFESCPDN